MQNLCRTIHEHRAEHDEQEHGEHQQHLRCGSAEIAPNEFGQVATAVAHREHAHEVVVNGSGEDAAEDYPEICRGSKLGAHDCTEDRSGASDVEELYHEHLPIRHRDIVQTIGLRHGWRNTVVGCEDALHEASVDKVAQHKGCQTD